MILDSFSNRTDSVSAPATAAVPITPSDSAPLGTLPKAIYVGTGGDIVMRGKADTADQVWRNLPNGALVPFRAAYVRAAGTTAADLLALY